MAWVTTELRNVVLNPFQGLSLVTQPIVGFESGAIREESISPDAVVDTHDNNGVVASGNEATAVDIRVGVLVETSTLNMKEDGQL